MRSTRPVVLSSAGAVTLAASLLLSGCVNPLEAVVNGALQDTGIQVDQTDGGFSIQNEDGSSIGIGATTIPADFPADIPLPDGTITAALATSGNWALTYTGVTAEQLPDVSAALEAAGYTQVSDLSQGDTIVRTFAGPSYSVTYTLQGTGPDAPLLYGVATNVIP